MYKNDFNVQRYLHNNYTSRTTPFRESQKNNAPYMNYLEQNNNYSLYQNDNNENDYDYNLDNNINYINSAHNNEYNNQNDINMDINYFHNKLNNITDKVKKLENFSNEIEQTISINPETNKLNRQKGIYNNYNFEDNNNISKMNKSFERYKKRKKYKSNNYVNYDFMFKNENNDDVGNENELDNENPNLGNDDLEKIIIFITIIIAIILIMS